MQEHCLDSGEDSNMKNIDTLRKKLDSIDTKLLNMLAQRMTIVEEIGKIKKEKGLKALDKKRWEDVLHTRKEIGKRLGLSEKFIENMWNLIHKQSLEKEKNI